MPTISEIFTIPSQAHQGDFVLRLTEGVTRPGDTLALSFPLPTGRPCKIHAEVVRTADEGVGLGLRRRIPTSTSIAVPSNSMNGGMKRPTGAECCAPH